MVTVADDQNIDIMALAEIMHTLYDIVGFFSFTVNRYTPFAAYLLGQQVSSAIGHGQHTGGFICTFHGGHGCKASQHVICSHATGGIHHAGLNGVQQVHLTAALLYHVGGEVQYGFAFFGKISSCEYSYHTIILAVFLLQAKKKMSKNRSFLKAAV